MQVDEAKKYYAWEFENIRREEKPYKVEEVKKTWVEI